MARLAIFELYSQDLKIWNRYERQEQECSVYVKRNSYCHDYDTRAFTAVRYYPTGSCVERAHLSMHKQRQTNKRMTKPYWLLHTCKWAYYYAYTECFCSYEWPLSRGDWHILFICVNATDNNNVYHVQLIVNAFRVDMTVLLYWRLSSMSSTSCYMLLLKFTNEWLLLISLTKKKKIPVMLFHGQLIILKYSPCKIHKFPYPSVHE